MTDDQDHVARVRDFMPTHIEDCHGPRGWSCTGWLAPNVRCPLGATDEFNVVAPADAPLLAVLAAADEAEPRIVRAPNRPMLDPRWNEQVVTRNAHGRAVLTYDPPSQPPWPVRAADWPDPVEVTPEGNGHILTLNGPPFDVEDDVPWVVSRKAGGISGVVWAGPDSTVDVGDEYEAQRIRNAGTAERARAFWRREQAQDPRKPKTVRHDVAGVIT